MVGETTDKPEAGKMPLKGAGMSLLRPEVGMILLKIEAGMTLDLDLQHIMKVSIGVIHQV